MSRCTYYCLFNFLYHLVPNRKKNTKKSTTDTILIHDQFPHSSYKKMNITGSNIECYFLFQLLHDHTQPIPGEERWSVIGQFSSIGSMGPDKTKWLTGEFQRTLTTLGKSSVRADPPLHLVCSFNMYQEIEGNKTGQMSVNCSQFLLKFL